MLCGYDLTLEYPQNGHFPTLKYSGGENPISAAPEGRYKSHLTKQSLMLDAQNRFAAQLAKRNVRLSRRERLRARDARKRELAKRGNGTINSWYGCDLYDEMVDYAVNFTFPWCMIVLLLYPPRILTLLVQR